MRQGAALPPAKCATQIRSHAVTLRPTGAFGVVIVCLRSDAASRIVKAPLKELANTTIHLSNLFQAPTSKDRIAGIQTFLLRHLRPHDDSLANAIALHLRRNPTMPIHSLAAKLGFSARHLTREFNAAFGISPKRFARLARFQKILSVRRQRQSWAEVAYACGLTDQAHLVKEFQDIVGESPTAFFTHELRVGAAAKD